MVKMEILCYKYCELRKAKGRQKERASKEREKMAEEREAVRCSAE